MSEQNVQRPSVGRIVHVHSPGQAPSCRAAIVTAVWDGGAIDTMVFPPAGVEPYPATDLTERPPTEADPLDTGRFVTTWHWPERVA